MTVSTPQPPIQTEATGSTGLSHTSVSSKDLMKSFAVGVLGAIFFWALYRILLTKFPVNFFNPILMTLALTGVPLGMLSLKERPSLTPGRTVAWGLGLVLIGFGAFQFKDVSLHYLLLDFYYVYPPPEDAYPILGLLAVVLCAPLYFAWLVRAIPHAARWPRSVLGAIGVGVAVGIVSGHYLVLGVGGYTLLAATVPCALVLMRPWYFALGLGGLSIVLSVLFFHGEEAYFAWQIKSLDRIDDTIWTTNYKIDSMEFAEGRCYAPVLNTIVIALSCNDPDLAPLTVRRLTEALNHRPGSNDRMLEIGRATGFALPEILEIMEPEQETDLILLEGDPQIAADAQGRYAKYSGGIYKGAYDLRVGERRRVLETLNPEERFDTTIITSVGNMLVFYPMTFIAQENYLFTEEALALLFDEYMTPDGVAVMDRGSPVVEDIYFMAASLPRDVHVRVLWTKMIDFPFMGLPLVFVVASKSEEVLDRIVAHTTEATDTFTHVPVDMEVVQESRFTDDRPFMQWGLAWGFVLFTLPVLYGLRRWRRRVFDRLEGDGPPEGYRLEMLVGLICGFVLIWLSSKAARANVTGVNTGFIWSVGALFLGASLSLSRAWFDGSFKPRWAAASVGLVVTAIVTMLMVPFYFPVAIAVNIVGGLGLGIFLAAVPVRPYRSPRGFLRVLGFLVGLLLFQLCLRAMGYMATAGVACGLMGVVIVAMGRSGPTAASSPAIP